MVKCVICLQDQIFYDKRLNILKRFQNTQYEDDGKKFLDGISLAT